MFSCEISSCCCLKYPYSCFFFFTFLFRRYCCSVCHYVAITDHCNLSLFSPFNALLVLIHPGYLRFWRIIFFQLFSTHKIMCESLLVFLSSDQFVEVLLSFPFVCFFRYPFVTFLSSLVWWCQLPILPSTCK